MKDIKTTLIQKLSKTDNFPVTWASRNDKADYALDCNVFSVTTTPSPMYGYDLRDEDFEYAEKKRKAAGGKWKKHDFGACFVKDKTLRKVNGKWLVDLAVQDSHCRYFKQRKIRAQTDADGNARKDENGMAIPLLDAEGKVQTTLSSVKEGFITVELTAIDPIYDHALSSEDGYVQSDSVTKTAVNSAVRSSVAKNREKNKAAKKKGTSVRCRMSNADLDAKIASLSSKSA